MKVLLLGDASAYHFTLSKALAAAGHQVTVASAGSGWMDTGRNIDLSRSKGKLGGALLWLKLRTVLASDFKGYDVVQLHNPIFVNLRPHRVKGFFDTLRRRNGSIFLSQLGTDSPYVKMCTAPDCPLRYSEFAVGREPTPYAISHRSTMEAWLRPPLTSHCQYIYEHIDGAIAALYEYYLSLQRVLPAEKIDYAGIPIDLSEIERPGPRSPGKIRIMVACHKGREAEKGIDRILPVIKGVVADYQHLAKLDLVQDVPFEQFKSVLRRADIVVDQLYSYTPATTALMAMATGKMVVSGAEPEYYEFIGEKELRPIINVDPTNLGALDSQLRFLLDNPNSIYERAAQARTFVERHNDAAAVAERFVDFWERRIR